MRSRTEAAFAALFDSWRWNWDYEPHDLRGYVPDFVCDGLLVEVKGPTEEMADAVRKIENSGWSSDALIVSGELSELAPRGLFWTHSKSQPEPEWGEAMFFHCMACDGVSVCAVHSEWVCHLCGEHDTVCDVDCSETWTEAKNRFQWRGGL